MEIWTQSKHEAWSRRPHFAPKQLLTAHQLNEALEDELKRQRLLNRALHGHGVVFGYALTRDQEGDLLTKKGCVQLGCGLALDRHGRMLYWPGGWVCMSQIVGKLPDCEGSYSLCVHYAERSMPPDGCGPCSSEEARWRDQSVVFTLKKGCVDVNRRCPDYPEDACISHEDYLCQRTGAEEGSIPPAKDLKWACEKPKKPCRIECGDWLYDPEACIPLACVEICDLTMKEKPEGGDCEPDKDENPGEDEREQERTKDRTHDYGPEPEELQCEPRYGFCPCTPETCVVRPYVYRSPLLYELLNCCDVDLARVRDVSWSGWLSGGWAKRVPWDEFEARMTSASDGFIVWFSKPILVSTLHPASIFLTAIIQEQRADYLGFPAHTDEGDRAP